ncbi:MAG: Do family serine endopeptidase [Muribaculaceae bacterium]|nr:Do family serine endopeptidase [Muribaculaceae bacterium]
MKKIFLSLICISALGTSACVAGDQPGTTVVMEHAGYSREDFTRAAESTVNGVVSVKSYATPQTRQQYSQRDFFSDPFFEYFFGQPSSPRQQPRQQEKPSQRQIGLGSGVIISTDGYIVTNNHVIDGAERLEVTLNDNRNFNATVVGADPTTDIALIKIDAPDLHVIPMGDSEDLKVGEWVLAVGNPFGFTSTVTAGIVSAKARNISTTTGTPSSGGIESYIQTDAAVNQGNSGGALVNLEGELVGINTAIYSQNGAYIGCSFAIPTSIVSKVIGDLKQFGAVQRAYLGIMFVQLTPELIAEKKLEGVNAGIWVDSVEDRSAAREAGIEPGDIIIAINEHPTISTAHLQEVIARLSPGDTAVVTLIRDGKELQKTVKLRNRQGNTAVTRAGSVSDLGATMRELTADEKQQLEVRYGVLVEDVETGRFSNAGISKGTVLLTVNGAQVNKPSDVEKIYNAVMKSDDDKVLFIKALTPTGRQAFYAVTLVD